MYTKNELLPECPFYLSETGKSVVCEGLSEHNVLELKFSRSTYFRTHKENFCCSMNYETCPIGKMLFAKYEEGMYG